MKTTTPPEKCTIVPFPTSHPTTSHELTFADLYAGNWWISTSRLLISALGVWSAVEKRSTGEKKPMNTTITTGVPISSIKGHFLHDVTDISKDPECLPDFDILTAGFPCQPFSESGLRKGFEDRRAQHFFHILDILEKKRPQAFFLENVRGILRLQKGKAFHLIRASIESLGYSFHWKIVKACEFGLPQYRPRVFMVGFRRRDTPFAFPAPIPLKMNMSDIFGAPCLREIGLTILCGGRGKPIDSLGRKINGSQNWDGYIVDGKVRRLNQFEAARMQGFPSWFHFPVSESRAMLQLGNSVAVPAVRAVGAELIHSLTGEQTAGQIALPQAA